MEGKKSLSTRAEEGDSKETDPKLMELQEQLPVILVKKIYYKLAKKYENYIWIFIITFCTIYILKILLVFEAEI